MMVIAETTAIIATAAGAAKGMVDTVKGIRDLVSSPKAPSGDLALREKLTELFDRAMETQEVIAALTERCGTLEKENRRLVEFNDDRENYTLRAIAPHSFAYTAKATLHSNEAKAYFCVNCFDRSEKSLLQLAKRDWHMDTLKCPRCGTHVFAENDNKPEIVTTARRRWLD